MNRRAQGAIEYLLIIGAAIVVVVVVVLAMNGVVTMGKADVSTNTVTDSFSTLRCQGDANSLGFVSLTDHNFLCCTTYGNTINPACTSTSGGSGGLPGLPPTSYFGATLVSIGGGNWGYSGTDVNGIVIKPDLSTLCFNGAACSANISRSGNDIIITG